MQHLIDKLGGDISIHAPRTGSDASQGYAAVLQQIFQSTLPTRGATRTAAARTAGC